MALAGAQAHEPDRPRRRSVERLADELDHDLQPLVQARPGFAVLVVPGHVVPHDRRDATRVLARTARAARERAPSRTARTDRAMDTIARTRWTATKAASWSPVAMPYGAEHPDADGPAGERLHGQPPPRRPPVDRDQDRDRQHGEAEGETGAAPLLAGREVRRRPRCCRCGWSTRGASTRTGRAWRAGGGSTWPRTYRPGYLDQPVKLRLQRRGDAPHGRPAHHRGVRGRVPRVPRRQRQAEARRGRQEVRLGRGRRRRRHVRGGRPRAGAARPGRGQGSGGPSASTPASATSPAPRSTAAASCPARYDRLYSSLEGEYEVPGQSFFGIGLGMVAPTIKDHAQDHVKAKYLPAMYRGRPRRLPAVQRAGRRLRPRRPADQGRARRRRVGHHRPEGVDLGRAVLRHRRDHLPHRPRPAQAQGPHRLRRRHARARRRGATAAPDDRRRLVQRGVLQRGAGARRPPPRRRQPGLVGRAHHAHERALLDRRRRRRRRHGARQRHPPGPDAPPLRLRRERRPPRPADGALHRASRWRSSPTSGPSTRSRPASCPAPRCRSPRWRSPTTSPRTAEFVASVLGPRLVADTGEWGTYAWSQFVCGTPGHAHRRRLRRGAAQHRRRAGARPPQGRRHRLQDPFQGHR